MWANVPGTTWRAEGRPTRPNTSAAGARPCRLALCRHPLATTIQRVFDHQRINKNGTNASPRPAGRHVCSASVDIIYHCGGRPRDISGDDQKSFSSRRLPYSHLKISIRHSARRRRAVTFEQIIFM